MGLLGFRCCIIILVRLADQLLGNEADMCAVEEVTEYVKLLDDIVKPTS